MKLIVGLGNPGKEYEKTRHNIGFMVLDAIADELQAQFCDMSRWSADTTEFQVHGEKVVLLKPLTFMNKSGQAVGTFAHYYKLEPKDIWVVSDDIDMPLGRIRVRHEGSSGGHNGLKSIIEHLGTENFTRIRLGVAEFTGDAQSTPLVRTEPDASILVLQPFKKREEPLLATVIATAKDRILDGLQTKTLEARTIEVDSI